MQKHCRRMSAYLLSAGAAAVFGVFSAQAATLGHSRVTSLPQQPLRIVVQLKDLSPAERQSISVQVAPASAWKEAGLTPPVVLDSLSAQLVAGVAPNSMQLVLQSAQVAQDSVLDVLVDVKTASSTQRHQVSVLQAQQATPISLAQSNTDATTAAVPAQSTQVATPSTPLQTTAMTGDQQIRVRKGQYLYKIARQLRSDQYNDQQMMAALLQANPDAFIQGNMNLIRAGATLQVPDAATVASISPQQARQLYQKHLEWFDEYRQRIAKGQGVMPVPAPTLTSMTTEADPLEAQQTDADKAQTPTTVADPISSSTDRLQLAAQTDEQAKADQTVATAQDLAHTAERLALLEGSGETADSAGTTGSAGSVGGQPGGGATTSPLATESGGQTDAALVTSGAGPEGGSATTATGQGIAATQANSGAGNNAADSSLSSTSSAAAADATAAENPSWIQDNFIRFILGGLLLVVLFVTWFLRRGHSSRLAYAESVSNEHPKGREKIESTSTDEVEFREKN